MARVLVSVPTGDGLVWSQVDEALGNLDRGGHEVVQRNVSFYGVDEARNGMAQRALDNGCDYLLMVDSDTVLPSDALVRLIENDVDVCLGYYTRGPYDDGSTPIVELGRPGYDTRLYEDEIAELEEEGHSLLEVKAGGMGCALIKTGVFKRLQKPWFVFKRNPDGSTLSEDYFFCQKCWSHGIKVHLDTRVACGHIKVRIA